MALFRRNSNKDLPEEVRQYYEAERRDRPWLAWLLALASLIIVVLIVAGLFFGGRWIVRKIRGNDEPAKTTIDSSPTDNPAPNPNPNPNPQNPPAQTPAPAPAPSPAPSPSPTPATPPAPAPSPAPSPTPSSPTTTSPTPKPTPATPSPTPSTGSQAANNGQLTNTGPGEVIAVFAATVVAGTAVHYVFLRRRLLS